MRELLVLPSNTAPPRASIRSQKAQEELTTLCLSARMPPRLAGQPGLKSNKSLSADGTPLERPQLLAGHQLALGLFGLCTRAVETEVDESIQARVARPDAPGEWLPPPQR